MRAAKASACGLFVPLAALLLSCAPAATVAGPKWLTANDPERTLDGWDVIFVAGFLNEFIPGYFADNVEVARQLGATTSIVLPPSNDTLDDDVALIERALDHEIGRTVVLLGHSKGGAGVLLTALRAPGLVLSGKVDAVIVLQGSIGGSLIADDLKGLPVFENGMEALTRNDSHQTFTDALNDLHRRLRPEQRSAFFERIFYVRSAQHTATLAAELGITHAVLNARGANDGLLNQDDMLLGEGVDLGILDADHAGLTVSSFLATTTPDERRAFTHALFREVGHRLKWKEVAHP
ncbi:MAG: hypothetical protein ACO1OB_16515 [Archangium sp.]